MIRFSRYPNWMNMTATFSLLDYDPMARVYTFDVVAPIGVYEALRSDRRVKATWTAKSVALALDETPVHCLRVQLRGAHTHLIAERIYQAIVADTRALLTPVFVDAAVWGDFIETLNSEVTKGEE